MKALFIFSMFFPAFVLAKTNVQTTQEAIELMKTTSAKLQSIKQIKYLYSREINNRKDNYFNKTSASCYIDFEKSSIANPFLFQFQSEDGYQQIYNGSEYFTLSKSTKTLEITPQPTADVFKSFSYFYNALPVMRMMMAKMADDDSIEKSVGDTLLENTKYKVLHLSMENKAINYNGGYRPFSIKMKVYYDIFIDSENQLPHLIIEHNSVDKNGYDTKTRFLNLDLNPEKPTPKSWYYSTYQPEYQLGEKVLKKQVDLIGAGQAVESWILPAVSTAVGSIKKDQLKGKIVLMDFWIKNCGPCMESFPKLKALQEKYGKENFALLSINSYEDKRDVDFFYKREKPDYTMLYQGKQLAERLGVYGYPAIVITDGEGKVIYSKNGFNFEEIDKILKVKLQM